MADHWINAIGTKAAQWRAPIGSFSDQVVVGTVQMIYNGGTSALELVSAATFNTSYFNGDGTFVGPGFRSVPNSNNTSVTLTLGTPAVQVLGDDTNSTLAALVRFTNDATGPVLLFGKSRGSLGSVTIVAANDFIGSVSFQATRTSVWNESAYIRAQVVGTVSNTAIPTRLVFGVTPAGSLTPATELTIDERGTAVRQLRMTGLLSPTSISTSQNNYTPTGWSTAGIVRINATANLDITGFAAPATDGEIKVLMFVGTNTVTLKDESGSSTAANRLALTADTVMATDDVAVIQYDTTSTRWRVIASTKVPGQTGVFGTMAYQNANAVSITGGQAVFSSPSGVSSSSAAGILLSSEATSSSFSGSLLFTTSANNTHTAYTAFQHIRADAAVGFIIRGDGRATSITNMHATGFTTTSIGKGTVGSTSTIVWADGQFQTLTTTTLTPLTLTFTAPAAPCACYLKITAPAAGTSPAITYPATVKGSPPTAITLGRYTLLYFFYDGTNYNFLGATQNVS